MPQPPPILRTTCALMRRGGGNPAPEKLQWIGAMLSTTPTGFEPTAKPAEIMQVTAKSGAKSGAVSNSLPNSSPNHQINSQSRRPHPKDRLDAGLQSLIDVWAQLPDPVRAAILMLSGLQPTDLSTISRSEAVK